MFCLSHNINVPQFVSNSWYVETQKNAFLNFFTNAELTAIDDTDIINDNPYVFILQKGAYLYRNDVQFRKEYNQLVHKYSQGVIISAHLKAPKQSKKPDGKVTVRTYNERALLLIEHKFGCTKVNTIRKFVKDMAPKLNLHVTREESRRKDDLLVWIDTYYDKIQENLNANNKNNVNK